MCQTSMFYKFLVEHQTILNRYLIAFKHTCKTSCERECSCVWVRARGRQGEKRRYQIQYCNEWSRSAYYCLYLTRMNSRKMQNITWVTKVIVLSEGFLYESQYHKYLSLYLNEPSKFLKIVSAAMPINFITMPFYSCLSLSLVIVLFAPKCLLLM